MPDLSGTARCMDCGASAEYARDRTLVIRHHHACPTSGPVVSEIRPAVPEWATGPRPAVTISPRMTDLELAEIGRRIRANDSERAVLDRLALYVELEQVRAQLRVADGWAARYTEVSRKYQDLLSQVRGLVQRFT